MDEMTMVRELLAEPEPSPDVVEAGRERLFDSPARSVRRRAFRRPLALGLTAVAAALFAAMLLPGLGSAPRTAPGVAPHRSGPSLDVTSARSVLLTAAVHAQSTPTTGTYWHMRSVTTTTLPRPFGPAGARFTLVQTTVDENWARRDGKAWTGSREWVTPKTPADVSAWRRDGARSRWCFGHTDTNPPLPVCLRTAPGSASLSRNYFAFEVAEGHVLTFAQLQRLPHDANALRTWLTRITRHDLDPSASVQIIDFNVTEILSNLLVYQPVPPAVRAAAFRALADMPGVTSTGRTHDRLGRPGVGIRIDQGRGFTQADTTLGDQGGRLVGPRKPRKLTRILIVDPTTSHILSDQQQAGSSAGTSKLIETDGWTNETPHVPARLP